MKYYYDGFGRRVTRVAPNAAIRRYIYDGDHVLLETNGSGSTERMYSYYPGVDQPHSVREFMGSVKGRYHYTMELPGHVSGLVASWHAGWFPSRVGTTDDGEDQPGNPVRRRRDEAGSKSGGRSRRHRERVVLAFRSGVASLIVLASFGCSTDLDSVGEIAGTYVLSPRAAGDTLTLSPDGQYERKYCDSVDCRIDSGAWEVEFSSGEPRVVLADFLGRWGTYGSGISGYWSTYAQRNWLGHVWLNVNEDLGLAYRKE